MVREDRHGGKEYKPAYSCRTLIPWPRNPKNISNEGKDKAELCLDMN
jgi:hypothetical protein